ncbi:MAG: hypothetical protein A3H31_08885 [Gallionellales bacterium RIFCSPLOWO2_02_FULL_57_47]|nr:MAG: hypothetical protein A3H31_08885 [Gallionellales bacterium RIFCSPLOWO2_02_FULL_57_47]
MPVALRLAVRPLAIVAEAGVMAIAVNVGATTFSVAVLEVTPSSEAVMLLLPTLKPVAVEPLKVAAAVLLEFQVTEPDMLPVLRSA